MIKIVREKPVKGIYLSSIEIKTDEYKFGCVGLENVSKAIPKGDYYVINSYSRKFSRNLWYVQDVEDRSGIMFHNGNYLADTQGCILVGEYAKYGVLLNSLRTLDRFLLVLDENKIYKLNIK